MHLTPHFLSLNQDIVAWSQEEKCVLKYVMSTSGSSMQTSGNNASVCLAPRGTIAMLGSNRRCCRVS